MGGNILCRSYVLQGVEKYWPYNKEDPSITGKTRRYITAGDDERSLVITGRKGELPDRVRSAEKNICKIIREQIFEDVFGEEREKHSLDEYAELYSKWMKERTMQTSSGKELAWSQEKAVLPLGEGLLNFLYADFETIQSELRKERVPYGPYRNNRKFPREAEQTLYDFLSLAETLRFCQPLIDCSVYTALFPPIMADRTEEYLEQYCSFLRRTQKDLMKLIRFVFDAEYCPDELGSLSASQRYALYCRLNHIVPRYEYTSAYDCMNGEIHPDLAFSGDTGYPRSDEQETEMPGQGFFERYNITPEEMGRYAGEPFYFFSQIQISNIPDMLMFEFFQMLTHHVRLKKCSRCGRYFVMKGNHKANYCSRREEGMTRSCQQIAAQERYKKKTAENPAISLEKKYYNRYKAQVKVRKLSEEDFHRWKCQAVMMRDDCTAGIITLEEFTTWLEENHPNRESMNRM